MPVRLTARAVWWATEADINAVIDAVVGAVDEGRLAPDRLGDAARHVHDGDSD